jgi:hypothetical protein
MPRPRKNRRLLAELTAHEFYVTVAACDFWFSVINDEVFGNKLKPVTMEVRRLRGVWGYYEDDKFLLVMTDTFPSKNLFLNVLAHEMVHAYQHQQGNVPNHNKTFWDWRKRFARNGLSLAISYDGERSIS